MPYQYPTILDQVGRLVARLGSHWSSVYEGRGFVRALMGALATLQKQVESDFLESAACLSIDDVPVWHTERWYPLVVHESEVLSRLLRYGEGSVYGPQPGSGVTYKYGGRVGLAYPTIELPVGLIHIPVIANKANNGSVCWVHGVDYTVDNGLLTLLNNPFEIADFEPHPVQKPDGTSDRQVTLLLRGSLWDRHYAFEHFGYVVDMHQRQSSDDYVRRVQAVWKALVEGTAEKHYELFFAALVGSPPAVGGDTVTQITQDNYNKLVISDQFVYRCPLESTITVSVGDVLEDYQPVSDRLTFYDLTSGEIPAGLDGLLMPASAIGAAVLGGLFFENTDVALAVEENVGGKTKISFPLGGDAEDVAAFWDAVHQRALDNATSTLAELLDVRGADAPSQPTAASLPATINPLEFLVANVLRYNASAVRVKVRSNSVQATAIKDIHVLRRIVPPWTILFVLLDYELDGDSVVPDVAGNSTTPGSSANLSAEKASSDLDVSVNPATLTSERLNAFYLNDPC